MGGLRFFILCAGIHTFPCCRGTVGFITGLAPPPTWKPSSGSYIRAGADFPFDIKPSPAMLWARRPTLGGTWGL
jgi:hypothetical protein